MQANYEVSQAKRHFRGRARRITSLSIEPERPRQAIEPRARVLALGVELAAFHGESGRRTRSQERPSV